MNNLYCIGNGDIYAINLLQSKKLLAAKTYEDLNPHHMETQTL